ncbi:MAG: hypothetical protein KJ626_03325 [Verrucomicrobia bacterium]|nr:hypothetical protein [Verrucomicrobiota bacterium]
MLKAFRIVLIAGVFIAVLCVLAGRSAWRPLDHDENLFVTSGCLLAREGMLPYKDIHYFHTPMLSLVYAAIFTFTDYLLLGARSFSVLCSWSLLLLIFLRAYSKHENQAEKRDLMFAVSLVGLLCFNSSFTYASGLAWNHDAPSLTSVAAYIFFIRSYYSEKPGRGIFWSGILIGVSFGLRSSFALLAIPFASLILWRPPSIEVPGSRFALLRSFVLGTFLGASPVFITFVLAPREFVFGNLEYIKLNTLYRNATHFDRTMTLPSKVIYFAKAMLTSPSNVATLILLALAISSQRAAQTFSRLSFRPEMPLAIASIPFLYLGALGPTPTWDQYLYAPLPFVFLTIAQGIKVLPPGAFMARVQTAAAGGAFAIALWFGFDTCRSVTLLPRFRDWSPVVIHKIGEECAQYSGWSKVLTLAPLYPLEGGARIYEEFATGPFAWRTAEFLHEDTRRELRVIGPDDLTGLLQRDPPMSILTGLEVNEDLEKPLLDFANSQHFQRIPLTPRGVLYVR